jgi:co-chaperonin GroES (HSP10)
MTLPIIPLGNKVLLKQVKKEMKTNSGILLQSDVADGESFTAIVEAIGPDVKDVKIGENVLPNWQKSHVLTLNMDKLEPVNYVMITEDEIMAVLE